MALYSVVMLLPDTYNILSVMIQHQILHSLLDLRPTSLPLISLALSRGESHPAPPEVAYKPDNGKKVLVISQ